jgi:dinuclear metal center YbgI/SA1388 family protein
LARAGIAVYSPHTAIDAAIGGVNDWLADGLSGKKENEVTRKVITPVGGVDNHEGAGMGRLVTLKNPVPFDELVRRVKSHLGLEQIQVAVAPDHRSSPISSIALCAGSGDSVLRGVKADVHFTGEMSHHAALNLIENGTSAIVCGHSNTERGFLKVLQKQLSNQLERDYDGPSEVIVSSTDKDPLQIV